VVRPSRATIPGREGMARMTRNYARDYREMPEFAKNYIGRFAIVCIDDYAEKRKVVRHRIGKVFWGLVDDGAIKTETMDNGYEVIIQVK